MKYYRWTTQKLVDLKLGERITAVCTDENHQHCVEAKRGCISVLKGGFTIRDREERERAAVEALDKCRRIKISIREEACLRKNL